MSSGIQSRVEKLCEALVLADRDDAAQLKRIQADLGEIAAWAASSKLPLTASAAEGARALVGQVIAGTAAQPAAALGLAGRVAAAIQAVICHGQPERDVEFPAGLPAPEPAAPKPSKAASAEAKKPAAPPQRGVPAHLVDDELLHSFVLEAKEHLESIEAHILSLEGAPRNEETIHAVFRAFHTIKGAAAFLNFEDIERVGHEMESLLELVRKGDLAMGEEVLDATFDSVDVLKQLVGGLQGGAGKVPPAVAGIDALLGRIATLAKAGEKAARPARAPAAAREAAEAGEEAAPAREAGAALPSRLGDTIRVDAERLDRLLDTIGELVIAESMVSHSTDATRLMSSPVLDRQFRQLDKITRSLQEMSSSLRMVSIRPVFLRMARLVRDLTRKGAKQIDFMSSGEDTELDKTIVDRIVDPLVHLLRNAVDHGIEAGPAQRRAAGKPETARIEMRAFHRGGSIYIEVEDDGRGLDKAKIVRRAVDQGMISPNEPATDGLITDLICRPGFSTADKVTEVSGRGVGMDVLKRTIEELRGQIDVRSEEGRGCVVSIRLPLTLAIIDGMIIRVGEERYIVPKLSIVRCIRPKAGDISTVGNRGEVLLLDGALIPLFRLHRLFEVEGAEQDATRALVAIVEDNECRVGLLVDELVGQQQIVIKGMGEYLSDTLGISGGGIMSNGQVGLIVDVDGLVKLAHAGAAPAMGPAAVPA